MVSPYYIIKISKKRRFIALFLLLIGAAILRFWRLESFTEFLGDQGRTGIIVWNAWSTRTLPLFGPPVLTGQHLGPFFYYFIAFPFIFSHFNALGPAIWMALFGILSVYLVFFIGSRLFGFWTGMAIASLYTVSPFVVMSDRTLWEPNIMPFFVLLYIFLILQIYQERKFFGLLPLGIVVGILIQLHYPALMFIPLTASFIVFLVLMNRKNESPHKIFFWSLFGLFGFIFILSPFLFYETRHSWSDITGLVSIVHSGEGIGKKVFLRSFVDYSSRLFYNVFPFGKTQAMVILWIAVILSIFLRLNFWNIFFAIWFMIGIAGISLYTGIVFDHYLNFILPVPFFLLGSMTYRYKKYIPSTIIAGVVIFGIILHLKNLRYASEPTNDIARTHALVSEMIALSSGKPFSFTLMSSRSFSDLHYRYFFTINRVEVQPISSDSYMRLFLICEKGMCPLGEDIQKIREIKAICYKEFCSGTNPMVDLRNWLYVGKYDAYSARLYFFTKKSMLERQFPVQ